MGFVYRKNYVLKFSEELDALEVRMNHVSVDTLLELRNITGPEKVSREEANKTLVRGCEIVAEHLIDWNLEDDNGNPVPADLTGVRAQPKQLLAEIILAWQEAMEGVPANLPKPSPSGEMLAVANIPMEPLLENLPS